MTASAKLIFVVIYNTILLIWAVFIEDKAFDIRLVLFLLFSTLIALLVIPYFNKWFCKVGNKSIKK